MSALQSLHRSVDAFANIVINLPDGNLDRPWKWGDYDEGVRFLFFRIYETLRELADDLVSRRASSGQPQTRAQAILGGYQASYRRLQLVLMGINDEFAALPPAEKDWPLRNTMAHILGAELSFWKINAEALQAVRNGIVAPPALEDKVWEAYEAEESIFKDLDEGGLSVLMKDHGLLNQRTIQTFSSVSDAELDTPVWFWESQPKPLHFRLRRFDSHIAQHTIQAEKTLDALNFPLTESRRLLFLIYQALAACEGSLFGAEMDDAPCVASATGQVEDYVRQVAQAL